VTTGAREHDSISREDAAGQSVRDVMYLQPNTLPAATTVGELREQFQRRRGLRTALITDGDEFLGAIGRDDLDPSADDDEPAANYTRRDIAAIGADEPAQAALERLDDDERGHRLVVLSDDGRTLLGLICLNSARTHFCLDAR
jgi:predicted transcriptional regulator